MNTLSEQEFLKLTEGFTGRAWVFKDVSEWLVKDATCAYLLTGGPGTGKSAIAARLVQMSLGKTSLSCSEGLAPGNVTFDYFCRALSPALNPLRFIEALSLCLANRYEIFRCALQAVGGREISIQVRQEIGQVAAGGEAQLTGVRIENLRITGLGARAAFDQAVRRPLEQLCNPNFHEKILILVDALDEALTFDPNDNIASLLAETVDHPADLPSQVRLLLTSRPDDRVLNLFSPHATDRPPIRRLDLIENAPDDVDDLRAYTLRRLSALPAPERDELATRICQAGSGNFLYARYVLDDLLAPGKLLADAVTLPLPTGLAGIYRTFLQRELARQPTRWEREYRPILGALTVARSDGLTPLQLSGITGLPQSRTDDILDTCSQYLTSPAETGRFCIYHQSFRDFLLADSTYPIYPAEANQAIADFFLAEYQGRWMESDDLYSLRYAPDHLIEALLASTQRRARSTLAGVLASLLSDLDFIEAKGGRIGIDALLDDFSAYQRRVPLENLFPDTLLDIQRVLDREAYAVRGWDWRRRPGFFAEQLYNRATDFHLPQLAERAEKRLTELSKPYLALRWRSGPESRAVERILTGHAGPIRGVAITPAGTLVISGAGDATVRIWELVTGKTVRILTGHSGPLRAVAALEDGKRVISAADDGTIRVWDMQTGQPVRLIDGFRGPIAAAAPVPGTGLVLVVAASGELTLWEFATGRRVRRIGRSPSLVNAIAISSNGGQAVLALADNTLQVWDLAKRCVVRSLIGHENWVLAVALVQDGSRAISASADNTLRLWDLTTGQTIRVLRGHTRAVAAVAMTRDGRSAISTSDDHTIRIWDLEKGALLSTLSGHEANVRAVALSPDEDRIVSGSDDRTLRVWDRQLAAAGQDLSGHTDKVEALAVAHDGQRSISASYDHSLRIWDMATGRALHSLTGHRNRVYAVAITPDSQHAVSASEDRTLCLWDLETGQAIRVLTGHNGAVNTVALTPDGSRVVSGSDDCTVRVWDLETGRNLHTFRGHCGLIFALAVTPDGRRAVSASFDSTLRVWDLEAGQELHILTGHAERVYAVAISPDGQRAISGCFDGTLKLWDLQEGRELRTFTGHTGWVRAVTFLPSGRNAISASTDGTMRIWDVASGTTMTILTGHADAVTSIALIDGGRCAVSISTDRSLRVWDLMNGQELAIANLGSELWCVTCAPDDKTLMVGDRAGNVHCLSYIEN